MLWFLQNHKLTPIIEKGYWKRVDWLAEDFELEECEALHAAYTMGGEKAVWPVLMDMLYLKNGDACVPLVIDSEQADMNQERVMQIRRWQAHGKYKKDEPWRDKKK